MGSHENSTLLATLNGNPGRALCLKVLALAMASLALAWHLDPSLRAGFDPALLWRNALPLLFFCLIVYGLCGRIMLTVVLSSSLIALVYKINAIKERNLNSPLTPGDVVLGHQVAGNIGFFAHYIGYHLIALVLAPILLIAAATILWRLETRRPRPHWTIRLALTALPMLALYMLLQGDRPWRDAYSNRALSSYQQWNPIFSAQSEGFVAAFVRMCQDRHVSVPAADKSLITQFAFNHAEEIKRREARQPPQVLPDIVVIQSEAFFDPGVLKKVDYGQFAPNFERLAAKGITGSLTTPTYGGGTIRTEFETLTGYPMLAFPAVQFPYFGLADQWMPTIPRRLQKLGYATTLFHPYEGQFWNREETMPELGFQKTYFEDAFKDAVRAGDFISDRSLFNFVLAHMDEQSSKPNYAMIITMENHGPWDRDAGVLSGLLGTHSLPAGLSPEGQREMTYYTSHLINGDAALAEFADQLLARPRWTLLLFYGDHLPSLYSAYNDLGFDDDKAASEQHTRYMLLSNRPFDPHQPRKLDLSSYDLPGLLFDTAGLPEDGYLALASTIRLAWVHGADTDNYRQVQFNAARLEVDCRRKLDTAGDCSP